MRRTGVCRISCAVMVVSLASSCGDDAGSASGVCDCPAGQVCAQSGICYEHPDCVKCTSTEVCVGGICYDASDPCARCDSGQVCVNGRCYEASDPCARCGEHQVCVEGVCTEPDKACDPQCGELETCVAGECVPCPVVCQGACCDGLCDAADGQCAPVCADGTAMCHGECCEGLSCDEELGCVSLCASTQTPCKNTLYMTLGCCDPGMVCEDMMCREDCRGGVRCDGVCCAVGEVCEEGQCLMACDAVSHQRCGDSLEYCCDNATEICLYQSCRVRGESCHKSGECAFDEFCEESTGTCVSNDAIPTTCEVRPAFGAFEPLLQWHWPDSLPGGKSQFSPNYNQVMMTPVVINMTDDNGDGVVDENDIPDVLFSTFTGGSYNSPGVIRAISGDDGRELAATEAVYHSSDDFGAADIDRDGVPELIAATATEIHALSIVPDEASPTGYAWHVKYRLSHGGSSVLRLFASFADLESDGVVDIVTASGVLNVVDGALVWKDGCHVGLDRPTLADLDGDGVMEIVTTKILDNHCKTLDAVSHSGFVAVADLMPDSENASEKGELVPELVRVVSGALEGHFEFYKIYKKDGVWSTARAWQAPIPINYERTKSVRGVDCALPANVSNGVCNSGGGAPVIADFNGDGIPDVGVAARWYYIVYSNDGTPDGGRVLWAHSQTQDYSSAVTGSSVFDFEGDGVAEVVYGDELRLRVYSGPGSTKDEDGDGYNDPNIIFDVPNSSGTLWEYPVIVDVDNDGSTEIVVSSNNYAFKPVTGVRAFEDPGGQWVRTRRIWNQHHYHVTNIQEDGSVPWHEEVNWLHPKLNNYRQNVQPGGLFNAPNLVAKGLVVEKTRCTSEGSRVRLVAEIGNEGSLGIKRGLGVNFYVENVNGTGKTGFIGQASVDRIIAPGNRVTVGFDWDQTVVLDGETVRVKSPARIYYVLDEPTEDKQFGEFVECIETDNTWNSQPYEVCPEIVN